LKNKAKKNEEKAETEKEREKEKKKEEKGKKKSGQFVDGSVIAAPFLRFIPYFSF
jgi:hypothetical protein